MNLEAVIKDKFTYLQKGRAFRLQEFDAWVFMFNDGTYGTAIPYKGEKVNEHFANVKYYSSDVEFAGVNQSYLILASTIIQLRNEFAIICANFLDLGLNKEFRKDIQQYPFSWWKKWRELLGNAVRVRETYSIIGEMITVKYLLQQGKNLNWKPSDYSTHDITSEGKLYEVKSTTSKYKEILTISSQFQLRDPDFLVFCRFEKTKKGHSINYMVDELELLGMDRSFLNLELEAIGYPEGALARSEKYKPLDIRKYTINEEFPGKELNDFLKNYSDPSVGRITYDIDLKGVKYQNIVSV
jgi:hypothetical protein